LLEIYGTILFLIWIIGYNYYCLAQNQKNLKNFKHLQNRHTKHTKIKQHVLTNTPWIVSGDILDSASFLCYKQPFLFNY